MKKSEINRLENLRAKANILSKKQDELVLEALKITGEGDEAGFTFDFILNNYGTVEELIERVCSEKK